MILSSSKVPHWDVINEMVDVADGNEDVNLIHEYDHDNHDSEADNDHEYHKRFLTGT